MRSELLKQVVEALIFASDSPISAEQIKSIVEESSVSEIRKMVEALNHAYKQDSRAFQILERGGGYQLVTRETYSQWVKKLFLGKRKSRLSQAALETLSVIAYKQPVSKPEVAHIRGVNCDGVIRTLLERKLLTLAGRADGPGRPLLYRTTKEFLKYFGVNTLEDLPKPREIEELMKEETPSAEDAAE